MSICIFCFKDPSDASPYCPENPGGGCHYGLHHEFAGDAVQQAAAKPAKQPDRNLCVHCGLHPRNPTASSNGCVHEFPQ